MRAAFYIFLSLCLSPLAVGHEAPTNAEEPKQSIDNVQDERSAARIGTDSLLPDLMASVTTLLAVLIGILGGIWAYYRQKEYELVQRRYLEEGLDVLISTAESSLNIFSHNWARSLENLKMFRDLDDMKPADLDSGFLDLPDSRFALTANYRVNAIVGSPTVWYVFQLVISFCQYGCTVARDEIPAALKKKLAGEIDATRKELVNEAELVLRELNTKSQRYQVFVGQMHRIAELFEKQRFRFSNVDKLRCDPVVEDVIKILEDSFADKFEEHGASETQSA